MDESTLMMWFIFSVFGLIVMKALVNWYHEIPKRNKFYTAQLLMLEKIARRHGVTETEIDDVYAKSLLRKPKTTNLQQPLSKKEWRNRILLIVAVVAIAVVIIIIAINNANQPKF